MELCVGVADDNAAPKAKPVDLYSIKVESSALVSLCFDWTSYNKHKKLLYFVATLLLMWGSRIQSHITARFAYSPHILSSSLKIHWIADSSRNFFSFLGPPCRRRRCRLSLQQLPELLPRLLWMEVRIISSGWWWWHPSQCAQLGSSHCSFVRERCLRRSASIKIPRLLMMIAVAGHGSCYGDKEQHHINYLVQIFACRIIC